MDDAQAQLDTFIDRFVPETADLARALLARMRQRVPGARLMVYDNWNGLVIGFGASASPSQAVLSLAVFPDHVTLCFLFGKTLDDPDGLLRGEGARVRHVRLPAAESLDDPAIAALIAQAVASSEPPFDPARAQELVIQSISPRQRPRRKETKPAGPAGPPLRAG